MLTGFYCLAPQHGLESRLWRDLRAAPTASDPMVNPVIQRDSANRARR
jgi:hypothetical protein